MYGNSNINYINSCKSRDLKALLKHSKTIYMTINISEA